MCVKQCDNFDNVCQKGTNKIYLKNKPNKHRKPVEKISKAKHSCFISTCSIYFGATDLYNANAYKY